MNYTVSDFYHSFSKELKLLAGNGGMSREINDVGILDYEMEPLLKDKYFHSNFHENLLVISTFSVIKENPFRISDIIKHLIDKGCSGLVIKNVFRLSISDTVLRYADFKNFPIFLVTEQNAFLETIIYQVFRKIELMQDLAFFQKELNILLYQKLSSLEIEKHVRIIHPSCGEQFFTIYMKPKDNFDNLSFEEIDKRFMHSALNRNGNIVLPYKKGLFFVYTDEEISGKYNDHTIVGILKDLVDVYDNMKIGISDYHLKLDEFSMSLHESLYAAAVDSSDNLPFIKYGLLGVQRLIFPFSESLEYQKYMASILKKILDYDIENNSHLFQTIEAYINSECNLVQAANQLGQHRNTLRYRLEKIQDLTGLDYKKFSHLEQISMAIKIYRCNPQYPA